LFFSCRYRKRTEFDEEYLLTFKKMRKLLLISLLFVMPASLVAQRMGFGHSSGHSAGRFGSGFGRGYGRTGAYGVPFYADYIDGADYYGVPGQPVIMQAPPPVTETHAPAAPLMIELQGDRYVQISGDEVSHAQMLDQMPTDQMPADAAGLRSEAASTPQSQRAATVLIFRDGHHQEISDYTIANGVLYASADYYSSGSWNQKIALSSLDLRETLNANQSRGNQFRVPSAANEVIVGP
jgi:hypothetical protein